MFVPTDSEVQVMTEATLNITGDVWVYGLLDVTAFTSWKAAATFWFDVFLVKSEEDRSSSVFLWKPSGPSETRSGRLVVGVCTADRAEDDQLHLKRWLHPSSFFSGWMQDRTSQRDFMLIGASRNTALIIQHVHHTLFLFTLIRGSILNMWASDPLHMVPDILDPDT